MKSFEDYVLGEQRKSALRDEQWRIERDRRRTRAERKMRRLSQFVNAALVVVFIILTLIVACTDAESNDDTVTEIPIVESVEPVTVSLIGMDVNKPAQEPVTYEDEFRATANRIDECMITHYCCEKRPHICGTGDGLTSTGAPVTAYWSCAVDKSVIPYGAEVMVDYGDGVVEFRKAQDCGAWIKGDHIDLAVESHTEAEDLGIKYATVYWR